MHPDGAALDPETEKIYARLGELERELSNLREG